jgi:hypothetical protein
LIETKYNEEEEKKRNRDHAEGINSIYTFNCLQIHWYRKDFIKVAICNGPLEDIKLEKLSKDSDKKSSKFTTEREFAKEKEKKERRAVDFVKHFDSPDSPYTAYIFPHFCGDVALFQIYANILDKAKKNKFLGIFKRNNNRIRNATETNEALMIDF